MFRTGCHYFMMIIYEVNLTINNEIYNDYYPWLVSHMDDMLQFRGFEKAEIFQEETTESNSQTTKLIVHYTVSSEANLQDYLQNHAAKMRAGSAEKFGDQFSAARRVFRPLVTVQSNNN